jgi:anti-anti-sigma factor
MPSLTDNSTLVVSTPAEITGSNAGAFKRNLQAALTKEHRKVEVNMRRTHSIDSCGLGVLVFLHKLMNSRAGSVRILHPSREVQKILAITRMAELFEIHL